MDPRQAVGDEEDQVDEQAVGGPIDLKVAEERIGAEEGERFGDDVWLVWAFFSFGSVSLSGSR